MRRGFLHLVQQCQCSRLIRLFPENQFDLTRGRRDVSVLQSQLRVRDTLPHRALAVTTRLRFFVAPFFLQSNLDQELRRFCIVWIQRQRVFARGNRRVDIAAS